MNETETTTKDSRLAWRLFSYTKPYRLQLAAGFVGLLVLSLFMNYIPLLIKHAIDTFINPETSVLSQAERIAGLQKICLNICALAALVFFLRYAYFYLMNWIGLNTVRDVRAAVFTKSMHLPIKFYDYFPVGKLMTRISSDMDALQNFVTQGVIGLSANFILLIGVMVFMLILNVRLALILFLALPLLFGLLTWVNWRTRKAHRNIRGAQAQLNATLQEAISGMFTIQLFNRENTEKEKFDQQNLELLASNKESVLAYSYYFPSIELMNALAVSTILAAGSFFVVQGEIAIGTVVGFLIYVRDFFRPLEELSDKSHILQTAMASCERIFGLLDEPLVIEDDPEAQPITEPLKGHICFEQVSFSYEPDNPILHDISFEILPGESCAIVGATGAGKTSIINLIARLYDIQEGEILIDGINIKHYRQMDLRRRIGVVQQEPFIFAGSIRENICMFDTEISDEALVLAAKHVHAHHFIQKLPLAYDTPIGEKGLNLSTGQKQLLALARTFVANPDMLFILDEATANVDSETEALIQQALNKLMQNRTSIVIAHRLSTIKDVDRIFVMKKGKIIEQGNHQALIDQEGYYAQLYRLLSHSATHAER